MLQRMHHRCQLMRRGRLAFQSATFLRKVVSSWNSPTVSRLDTASLTYMSRTGHHRGFLPLQRQPLRYVCVRHYAATEVPASNIYVSSYYTVEQGEVEDFFERHRINFTAIDNEWVQCRCPFCRRQKNC